MIFTTQQPKNHPLSLRSMAALIATVVLATACGGGGGGDNTAAVTPTPVGTTPTPTPTPVPINSDVATLADIAGCPISSATISSANWYSACLVGKRLVGKDTITSEACELRLKAGGLFEYVKNGVVVIASPPNTQWASGSGLYSNNRGSASGQLNFYGYMLFSALDPSTNSTVFYTFKINILDNNTYPTNPSFNDDTVFFSKSSTGISGLSVGENCKLNNI
jgi:hypothetical protein